MTERHIVAPPTPSRHPDAPQQARPPALPTYGALVISLDFELHWGVRDTTPADGSYRKQLLGGRRVVPQLLDLFEEFGIAATWATVGFLFASNRRELERFSPAFRPAYADPALDPYRERIGVDEAADELHFASSLIDAIRRRRRQEIATHTFSHYYCLEPGQDRAAFQADLESAVGIARARGIRLRSIVFPRNQYNRAYDDLLLAAGICCYRGNQRAWMYAAARPWLARSARLLDTYIDTAGPHTARWHEIPQPNGLCNVPASFFLRPCSPRGRRFEKLRHRRLVRSLEWAAAANEIVHLWWHPENFGIHTADNLAFLRAVLEAFARLRETHGMRSLTMAEVAELAQPVAAGSPTAGRHGTVTNGAWQTKEGVRGTDPRSVPERTAVSTPRIYLSPPHMSGLEERLVAEAFATNWITPVGPHIDAFEREFAAVVGAPHGAALSSGTAALHLALRLVGVRPGDNVFVSTLTFIASVSPIIYLGGTPVFIDSEAQSWNMDPALLAAALDTHARAGKLPRAVVVVHLYGQSADLYPILATCERYGVAVIEDAAEALGATYHGRAPGTFGRVGIYSFNGNKIITSGGGGMLVSKDEELVAHARKLATQARDPAPHYQHSEIGYNYRLSNVLAAIGRGQLRVLEDRVAARRRNFAFYVDALGTLAGIAFMPEAPWGLPTRWLTCLTIDPAEFGADREEVRQALEASGVEARPVWKPMHLQPALAHFERFGGAIAEDLFGRGLCLPSGSSLAAPDLERVVDVIRHTPSRTRAAATALLAQ